MATLTELKALIAAEDETWMEWNNDKGDGNHHWVVTYGLSDGSGRGSGEPGGWDGGGFGNDWTWPMLHEQLEGTIELLCMLIRSEEEERELWE